MTGLTKRQLDCLEFIHGFVRANRGCSPSYQQIMEGIGLKSKNGVHRLVNGLEARGYLRRIPHIARSLEVVKIPGGDVRDEAIEAARVLMSEAKPTEDGRGLVVSGAVALLLANALAEVPA